jgi:hypothetical protein
MTSNGWKVVNGYLKNYGEGEKGAVVTSVVVYRVCPKEYEFLTCDLNRFIYIFIVNLMTL